ncbi:MAG: nitroreductase family protein [Pseudomonadales bacterium]|nr:nitroreductase family protein [Pseudomonadales bacterium]
MELFEVMRTTFAARKYTGEEISDAVLFDILDNARFAPSGGNRQGNRVIVVRNAKMREALSKLGETAAKQYAAQIKAGENPWNSVIPTQLRDDEIAATPAPSHLLDTIKNASVALVFLVDLTVVASMDKDLDRVGVISGASIYPFVWNVLLAARQAGYGGTITTLSAACEAEVQELLNIPSHYALSAIVPLGKPVKQLTKLKRNRVDEFAMHERFDGKPFIV